MENGHSHTSKPASVPNVTPWLVSKTTSEPATGYASYLRPWTASHETDEMAGQSVRALNNRVELTMEWMQP